MPSLREIRGRIKSARNIQQITKAMKMVAAARLRRSQERMLAARPYADLIAEALRDLATREDAEAHPLLGPAVGAASRAPRRLVVFSADKGLCGSFNVNVLRRSVQVLREDADRPAEVVAVGRKGRDFFAHHGATLAGQWIQVAGGEAAAASAIAREQMDAYLGGKVSEVVVVSTEFRSVISLRPRALRLLPFDLKLIDPEAPAVAAPAAPRRRPAPPAYEPDRAEVFRRLVPRAIESQVLKTLLESQACEFAARMTAMDNASRNSKELITNLTLYANRIRQAVITKEIAELVGGAEALK